MADQVTYTADYKLHCPGCGAKVDANQYRREAQDPAPCGCAWVWENGELIAVPSLGF